MNRKNRNKGNSRVGNASARSTRVQQTRSTRRRNNGVNLAPVAMNKSSRQNGRNRLVYKECERILTLQSISNDFNVIESIPLNPGLKDSFPWLSGHAALYEKYRVKNIIYRYKNLVGTNTAGNVLFAFDYDTIDSAPETAVAFTQSTHYMDGAPWRILEFKVPSDNRDLFTRSGDYPIQSDPKTYDMGRLHIATEGTGSNTTLGYLEVEYSIELFDKQPSSIGETKAQIGSAMITSDDLTIETGSTKIVPFDAFLPGINQLGLSFIGTAGQIIGFQPNSTYRAEFYSQAFSLNSDSPNFKVSFSGGTGEFPWTNPVAMNHGPGPINDGIGGAVTVTFPGTIGNLKLELTNDTNQDITLINSATKIAITRL